MYFNGEIVGKREKIEEHVQIKPSRKVSFPTINLVSLGCLQSLKTQANTEAEKSLALNYLLYYNREKEEGIKGTKKRKKQNRNLNDP